jgi:hypothetical protein
MCEFYSPTGIVRRQLVSRQNVMIKPRLNIVAAGHPKRTIECLTGEISIAMNILCCYCQKKFYYIIRIAIIFSFIIC